MALVALGALLLGACGSSASSSASTTTAPPSGTSPSSSASGGGAATVASRSSSYGTILVNGSGMVLYLNVDDTATHSACTGACTTIWPPLTTSGSPVAGAGVTQSLLSTKTLSGGTKQVVYDGHPLYTYSADQTPGATQGQGIEGIWFVVSAAGAPVKSAQAAGSGGSSTTTTVASGGGY